ncbi:uncharacterized protein LOC144577198 [Callithrix jacchus]
MQIAGRTKEGGLGTPGGAGGCGGGGRARGRWGARPAGGVRQAACGRAGLGTRSVDVRVRARAPPWSAGHCAPGPVSGRVGAGLGARKAVGRTELLRRGWPRRTRTRSRGARPARRPQSGLGEGRATPGAEGALLPRAERLPSAALGDRTQFATSGSQREESKRRRRRRRQRRWRREGGERKTGVPAAVAAAVRREGEPRAAPDTGRYHEAGALESGPHHLLGSDPSFSSASSRLQPEGDLLVLHFMGSLQRE